MEVDRLINMGIMKRKINNFKRAASNFITPKDKVIICFTSNFRKLNKRNKRNPFQVSKIQDSILELEDFFNYATLYI